MTKDAKLTVEKLIRERGTKKFKIITTDNSSEFSTLSVIENDLKNLQIYYTRAFSPFEKESNERYNSMLEEFLSTGTSFRELKYELPDELF